MPAEFDIFISYARADDESFVRRLHSDLGFHGIRVWWDKRAMESRGTSFLLELRDAIAAVDRVVLVLGPAAVASDYVAAEWTFGLERCKVVVPLLRIGGSVEEVLPKALAHLHTPDFRDDARYDDALAELTRLLASPVPPLAAVDGVDPLPPHYLPREAVGDSIRRTVLADAVGPVVVTAPHRTSALEGMGGVGKSVAAAAFARTCETRRAFSDGIVWLRAGRVPDSDPESVRGALLRRVAGALGLSVDAGSVELVERAISTHLADRQCLMVLDDVWDTATVASVSDVAGPRCRVLITTRMTSIAASLGAIPCPVDLLTEQEAMSLLAQSADVAVEALPAVAPDVVRECGRLALAIAMIGAMVRGRPADRWDDALTRLRNADLMKIRRDYPRYPYPNLLRAIGVSIDALDAGDRERYTELAVFPQGVPIPDAALEALWAPAGVDGADLRDLIDRLVDRSLARLAAGGLLIHDRQHDVVMRRAPSVPALHARIVDSYRRRSPDGWAGGPRDGWFFPRLPWHLLGAGLTAELAAVLGDPAWLEAKLATTDLESLISDFTLAERSALTTLLPDALRLSASAVAADPAALRGQLLGRLPEGGDKECRTFRKRLTERRGAPWLRPVRPTLTPAGAARTRSIPARFSDSVAITRDFRLAVTAGVEIDPGPRRAPRARVVSVDTGRELCVIEAPHPDRVDVFAITADQRTLMTLGDDRTLRSWDLETGTPSGSVPFDGWIVALHPLADGDHALCETGDDVRIIDLRTGATESRLVVEPVRPGGCRLMPDETCVVVADWQGGVHLVEIDGWRRRWSSAGHAQYGTPMALDGSGTRLFVAEPDQSVVVLDTATGAPLAHLPGAASDYPITALAVAGDDLLVGMNDGALQRRDIAGHRVPVTWREHQNRVTAIEVSPDGTRALTASNDGFLSVWGISRLGEVPRPRAHSESVCDVAWSPDRRWAVSASGDRRVAVFDARGRPVGTSAPGDGWVQQATLLPDQTRLLTAQSGAALAVIDLDHMTWGEIARHKEDGVYHAVTLVDGGSRAAVSWYIDDGQDHIYGLALWEVEPLRRIGFVMDDAGTRQPLHAYHLAWSDGTRRGFSPREHGVTIWRIAGTEIETVGSISCGRAGCVAPLAGGERVAVALDDAVEVWDVDRLSRTARKDLPRATVVAASATVGLVVAGDASGGVHVLDASSLEARARYLVDASVTACTISDDGRMVVVGDQNGEVHLLALDE